MMPAGNDMDGKQQGGEALAAVVDPPARPLMLSKVPPAHALAPGPAPEDHLLVLDSGWQLPLPSADTAAHPRGTSSESTAMRPGPLVPLQSSIPVAPASFQESQQVQISPLPSAPQGEPSKVRGSQICPSNSFEYCRAESFFFFMCFDSLLWISFCS